jgi:hypothetical protein
MRHRIPKSGDGSVCRLGCPACCYDFLALVMPRPPAQRVVLRWNDREREQATDWAVNVHLRASDNPVQKKAIPEHVKSAAEAMGFTTNGFYVYNLSEGDQ